MFKMDMDLFFNAVGSCTWEATVLIAEFGVSCRIEEHIAKIRDYGKSISDIDNDITVERLQDNFNKSIQRLKYKFFELNKASKKETGHYMFGILEETETLAYEMFEWLQNVI